jgi:cell division protein FtsB
MSSPEPVRRPSREVRPLDPATRRALRRARLTVVPRKIEQAARIPFLALVSLLAVVGVVTLLMFNTSLQQGSFAAAALQERADTLTAREEALKLELEQLRNPQRVAEQAQEMGMVIPANPDFLDLRDGSVLASSEEVPPSGLQLEAPPAQKPEELRAGRVVVQPEPTNDRDREDRRDRDDRAGDTGDRSPRSGDRDGRNGGDR